MLARLLDVQCGIDTELLTAVASLLEQHCYSKEPIHGCFCVVLCVSLDCLAHLVSSSPELCISFLPPVRSFRLMLTVTMLLLIVCFIYTGKPHRLAHASSPVYVSNHGNHGTASMVKCVTVVSIKCVTVHYTQRRGVLVTTARVCDECA